MASPQLSLLDLVNTPSSCPSDEDSKVLAVSLTQDGVEDVLVGCQVLKIALERMSHFFTAIESTLDERFDVSSTNNVRSFFEQFMLGRFSHSFCLEVFS